MLKSIQIVCFDNPYPPNYGGVIDVFYKIKALYNSNVDVYLHFFYNEVDTRKDDLFIEKFCKKVFLYKRKINLRTHVSLRPFIVASRTSDELNRNLLEIGEPIIYEGLNTTSSLGLMNKKGIKTFVRLHNVEHHYYKNIGKLEYNWFKKIYYQLEAFRLKRYQNILKKANVLFAISPKDKLYFSNIFINVVYLPVFQSKYELLKTNTNEFCLFHGDLRLSDNIKAAEFLINFFSSKTNKKLIIASSFENKKLNQLMLNASNISFKKIHSLTDLEILFKQTALHILFSYQSSGIKLKLLNALYSDTYVLANKSIVEGTGLETCCELFKNEEELLLQINKLFGVKISEKDKASRLKLLKSFNPNNTIKILIDRL